AGNIRGGNIWNDLSYKRNHPVDRDDASPKGRAANSVGRPGGGVVNLGGRGAQIAPKVSWGRKGKDAPIGRAPVISFVAPKVEQLVLDHTPAHKTAGIVDDQVGRLRDAVLIGEEVVGLGRGVGVVPVQTSGSLIAAALELHVHRSAAGQPLLGVV